MESAREELKALQGVGQTVARRDVIVVGASAGGVEALVELAGGLPRDLAAAVFVVLHMPIDAESHLPRILSRAGPLDAVHPVDGDPIRPGRIYVAPPNHHLLLDRERMRLTVGPRVNGVRPAIDALFQSAARAHGNRVIGAVLSGTLQDGTLGLDAIKLRGGVAIVQDPDEARFSSMPRSALERIDVDHCARIAEIPPLLVALTAGPPEVSPEVGAEAMRDDPREDTVLGDDPSSPTPLDKQYDHASGLSCPNCNGSVWELTDGRVTRIECRVGHAFSIEAFLGEQSIALEDALWSAINSLQERATTLRRFADKISTGQTAVEYERRADEVERHVRLLREGLVRVIQAETAQSA